MAKSLELAGMPISARCLDESLKNKPQNLTFTDKQNSDNYYKSLSAEVIDEIKGTQAFQTKINGLIETANSSGLNTISTSQKEKGALSSSIYFEKGDNFDLFGAFHAMVANINWTQKDGIWQFNVTLTDTYDFARNNGKSPIDRAANRAAIAQENGAITKYIITIQFNYYVAN